MQEKNTPRLFVDMDGTLAKFDDEAQCLERMRETDFFRKLKPFQNAVDGLKLFMKQNPETEVFILSACISDQCLIEKRAWLKEYLPEIDLDHQIMPGVGDVKADSVLDFRRKDILWDDYNKNLAEWERKGGIAVKCQNYVTHKGLNGRSWSGRTVSNEIPPEKIAKGLTNIAIQCQLKKLRLLSNIFPTIYFFDDYGDYSSKPIEASSSDITDHIDKLNALMEKEYSYCEDPKIGLMEYFSGSAAVSKKAKTLTQHFEIIGDEVMCITEVGITADLTEAEHSELIEFISGQNSDGLGEGFEQREIKTDEGILFVSLWSSDGDYWIKTEKEYEQWLDEPKQEFGLKMS